MSHLCQLPRVTDLPSHFQDIVTAQRLLRRGERIVVAVSGGVDSMVLLHLVAALAPPRGWKLSVAHFNHRLRAHASAADERLVRATARQLKLPCDVGCANVREHARREDISVEMAARELRHAFLARCAHQRKARAIVLAQHASDQVELFLMRLLRGASGEGLGGMKWTSASPADQRVKLVRPLLDCWKEQLLAHARAAKIRYREDASNAAPKFERNWVRAELLPLIARRHPAAARTLRRTMLLMQDEAALVGELARRWLGGKEREPFQSLAPALQRRIIQTQLITLGVEPDFGWIESFRANPGQPVTIAPGVRLQCSVNGTLARLPEVPSPFPAERARLPLPGTGLAQGYIKFGGGMLHWKLRQLRRSTVPPQRPDVEWFDADHLGEAIELGHWQPGDRFQPIGLGAAVKLQDWFTNRKIPAARRHRLVLAKTEHGEVFWVEGERIGELAKLTPATRRVLEWRWKRP